MTEDENCEKCAEQAHMEEISQKIKEAGKNSCTLCSSKINPDDRNKVVSGEYQKSLLKEDERIEFTAWYEAIARYSKQLNDALLSSESFIARMITIHRDMKHYDIKKDNGIIVGKLSDIKNLAQMAQVDMELIKRTLEQIEGKVHGNA